MVPVQGVDLLVLFVEMQPFHSTRKQCQIKTPICPTLKAMKNGMLIAPFAWHTSERQVLYSSNCN